MFYYPHQSTKATSDTPSTCPWPLPGNSRNNVPELFCWTKMGVEAGQSLSSIIQRKELERQLGNGMFIWGIGNAPNASLYEFARTAGTVPLLFSPILAKPRKVDTNPGKLILWFSYQDETGAIYPLPEHTLVTSRSLNNGNGAKKRHYALFCFSNTSLQNNLDLEVNFNELQNAQSRKPLGFSQVTAFVRRTQACEATKPTPKIYDVPLSASLLWPFCARLTNGIEVPGELASKIEKAAHISDSATWATFVSMVREEAMTHSPSDLPLF